MIRACCGTPDDTRAPSPHARDCRYAGSPAAPSGGPYCIAAGCPLHRPRTLHRAGSDGCILATDDLGIAYASMTHAEYAAARHAALHPDRDA